MKQRIKKMNENSSNFISDKIDKTKKEINELTKKSENDEKIKKLKEEYNKTVERADKIKDEIIDYLEKNAEKKEKKKHITICGVKIWQIMAYFVIYSFLGFCLETVYGLLTKGVIESRQSFLYGPFCGIYGVGATIMILLLQYFKKNNYTLFLGGYIIGSFIEYLVSLFGEMMLHVKWWDYSNEPFNLNGRVCLFYSIAWGIIAIYLVGHFNPKVDRFIEKIRKKFPKYILPIISDIFTFLLLADCVISAVALNVFYSRLVYEYDLNIKDAYFYKQEYEDLLATNFWKEFTLKHFSNEKMLKTYPNLKFEDVEGNIIFAKDYLYEIKPYYIKLFTPKNNYNVLTNVETVKYSE